MSPIADVGQRPRRPRATAAVRTFSISAQPLATMLKSDGAERRRTTRRRAGRAGPPTASRTAVIASDDAEPPARAVVRACSSRGTASRRGTAAKTTASQKPIAVVEVGAHLGRLAPQPRDQRRRGADDRRSAPIRISSRMPSDEEDRCARGRARRRPRWGCRASASASRPIDSTRKNTMLKTSQPVMPRSTKECTEKSASTPGAGQEGGVDHQQVGGDGEHQVEPAEPLAAPLQQHAVGQRGGRQPRHQRGVLDRVPAPVAAPAEGLVGPVAAEHDRQPEGAERRAAPTAATPWSTRRSGASTARPGRTRTGSRARRSR